MKQCSNCKIKFPEEILSSLITSDGVTNNVCGICALELRNKYLGTNDKKFQGEMAEYNRQEAIKIKNK